jgi:hypothetical protein
MSIAATSLRRPTPWTLRILSTSRAALIESVNDSADIDPAVAAADSLVAGDLQPAFDPWHPRHLLEPSVDVVPFAATLRRLG